MDVQLAAAFFGTLFFSMLFECPKKFLFLSGLNGLLSWFVYLSAMKSTGSLFVANFAATSTVAVFSQLVAFKKRMPLDVFLVPGLFVLVPGSTIYQMFHNFIYGKDIAAYMEFKKTLEIGFSIAVAIFIFVYIFEAANRTLLNRIKARGGLRVPDNPELVFMTAVEMGRVMLESGAETHKVEQTIDIFCGFNGLSGAQSFVIPTGIVATFIENKTHPQTELARVSSRSYNLGRIARIRELMNDYFDRVIDFPELQKRLAGIKSYSQYTPWEKLMASALGAAFFSLLFDGVWFEFFLCLITGFLTRLSIDAFAKLEFPYQLVNLAASMVVALLALALTKISLGGRLEVVIVGTVMLLVPGVTIINALREVIAGDLVAGSSRWFDALVIAAAIATGVGSVLKLFV